MNSCNQLTQKGYPGERPFDLKKIQDSFLDTFNSNNNLEQLNVICLKMIWTKQIDNFSYTLLHYPVKVSRAVITSSEKAFELAKKINKCIYLNSYN